MIKSQKFIVFILLLSAIVLAGCSAPGEIALRVTGKVAQEKGWTDNQVQKMDTIEAEFTNKAGEVNTYTGVPISALLSLCEPNSDASAVVFVADDGYSAEATLEEVQNCTDCIVSFSDQGGFSIVMPGFIGKLQVKGVIEIQVK